MAFDLDCFGCDDPDYVGFGLDSLGPLLTAGAGMASGAIADSEKGDAQVKAAAADRKAADVAIAADKTAALAVAKALASVKLKQPSAQIDKVAADNAVSAADKASAGLSSSASDLRAKAADSALTDAIKKAQAAPTDVYAQALVDAWTAISNKSHAGSIASRDDGDTGSGKKGGGGGGWWSGLSTPAKVGVGAGGVGVLGAIGYFIKTRFF